MTSSLPSGAVLTRMRSRSTPASRRLPLTSWPGSEVVLREASLIQRPASRLVVAATPADTNDPSSETGVEPRCFRYRHLGRSQQPEVMSG